MFVTHFSGVSHCNDFSLSKDDPQWPAYNKQYLHHYKLGRCKHMQVLHFFRHCATFFASLLLALHRAGDASMPCRLHTSHHVRHQRSASAQLALSRNRCASAHAPPVPVPADSRDVGDALHC